MLPNILTKLENGEDAHRRRLLLMGHLCSGLAVRDIKPVLVGGNAAAFMLHRDCTDFAYLGKKAKEYELVRGLEELEELGQSMVLREDG